MQLNKSYLLLFCLLATINCVSLECLYQLQNAQTIVYDIQTRILENDIGGAFAGFQFLNNGAKELKKACSNIPLSYTSNVDLVPKLSCKDSLDHIVDTIEEMAESTSIVDTIQKLLDFSDHFKEVCSNKDTNNYVYDTIEDSDEDEEQAPHFDDWNGKYQDELSEDSEDSSSSDVEEELEVIKRLPLRRLKPVRDSDLEDSDNELPPNFAKWNGSVSDSEDSEEEEYDEDLDDNGDEDSDEPSALPSVYDLTAKKDLLVTTEADSSNVKK